nr:hypothetical protein [Cohnella zeiphila]
MTDIPTPGRPVSVSVTSDGRLAYVSSQVINAVTVIDTASQSVAANLAAGFSPRSVAVTPILPL